MNEELRSAVDELHNVRRDKAVLSEREDALKKLIIESGYNSLDGYISTASVRQAVQKQINYKGLIKKLGVSVQRMTAYTSHVPYFRITTKRLPITLLSGTPGYRSSQFGEGTKSYATRPNYVGQNYVRSTA